MHGPQHRNLRTREVKHLLQALLVLGDAAVGAARGSGQALLLRGPQTPGELRGRAERMHRFEALDDVQSALQKLMQREPPLAKVLPRQPGTKESRYAHLFAGDVVEADAPLQTGAAAGRNPADAERIARLEEEVAELRREVSEVKDQLERFRRQFE